MNVSEKIRYRDLKDRRISTITIHNGRFHADDVFCAALCQIINPKIQIIRTRDLNEFKGLCCDVGGGRYDHHPINGARERTMAMRCFWPPESWRG